MLREREGGRCPHCLAELKRMHPSHLAMCSHRPDRPVVTLVTPVTDVTPMSNVTPCNKCNTKDAEIARLKALVTELERPKTAAERGAADGKKSRAAYMAKRRAAAKSKPSV